MAVRKKQVRVKRAEKLPNVFLDLDGTLADSLGALRQGYKNFLKAHGRVGTDAEFDRLNGPTLPEVAERLRAVHRLPHGRTEAVQLYRQMLAKTYQSGVKPMLGAESLLRFLKKHSRGVHLVTASPKEVTGEWIRARGWDRHFKTMTFGSEVRQGKPDPAIYEHAFRKAGLKPGDERIVLEDSLNGCLSAKWAGSMTVRVCPAASADVEAKRPVSDAWDGADLRVKYLAEFERWLYDGGWDRACYVSTLGTSIRARLAKGADRRKKPNRLLCLEGQEKKGGVHTFVGRYRSYWDFIGALRAGRPHPAAMAVGGFSTLGAGKSRKYLLGLRSKHVAVYPLTWEWVPAGGIDTDAVRPDGSIDLTRMIAKEFEEETGLPVRWIAKTRVYGVIRDRATNSYDFCMHLDLKAGADRARLAFPLKEYVKMAFLDDRGVRRFAGSRARLISTFGPAQKAFRLTLDTKGKGK